MKRIISFFITGGWAFLVLSSCTDPGKGNKKTAAASFSEKDTAAVSALLKKAGSFSQSDFDSLRYYGNQALIMAREINFPEGIGRARGMEANYQRRKGNYEEAITIGLEVIHLYDSIQLWVRVVKMKTFIADVYKEMGGEKGTPEYLQKGLDLAREAEQLAIRENDPAGMASTLNEQAIILRDMSKRTGRAELMDSAFLLLQKGIGIVKRSGQTLDELGPLYNNTAQIYNEHYKDYPKALDYQFKAVEFNTLRNNRIGLTHNYNTISEIYMNMGDMAASVHYAHTMLALCKELGSPFRMVNAYSLLTEVNRKMKRYDSALHYRELGTDLSDSINNVQKGQQIAEAQTRYETKEKEDLIAGLNASNKLKNQRLIFAASIAALLVIVAGLSFLQNRRLQKQKKQITEQSSRLQWMMKELHHRVKNNLQIVSSLLSLQTYRLKDEESVTAIKESQLRVQAMSLIHQRLYQVEDVSMVNFKLYLDDLVETLMRSYGYSADHFDLQVDVDKEFLDVDTVMPMGLLVNEIITNSFKYAYQDVERPFLKISLSSKDERLQLDIRDNGPGMAAGSPNVRGFGKKLIEALSGQLKATYIVDSSGGTAYHFSIPYKKEKAA